MKESFAKADRLRDLTYWSYGVLLLITLVAIWLISRGLYFPVQSLLKNVLNGYSSSGTDRESRLGGDELSVLSRVFQHQKQEINQLNKQRNYAEKTSKEIFLRDMLQRGCREYPGGNDEIGALFAKQRLAIPASSLVVMVFRIDDYEAFQQKYTTFDQHLMCYAMANIVSEVLEKYCPNETIDLKSDHIAAICETTEDELSALATYGQECSIRIKSYLNVSVTVAIGGYAENAESLHEEYMACCELTNERFRLGHGQIIESKNQIRSNVPYQYPEDKERLLLNELKLGRADGANRHFDHFLEQILKYSYSEARISLLRLLMNVAQALKMMRVENNIFSYGSLSVFEQLLERQETVGQFRRWFDASLQEIAKLIANQSTLSEKNQLLDRIKKIVDEHLLHPNLSTKFVAEQLQLSPVYVRQFFKEETGESLSGYVNALKLKRVQRRLIETDKSIEEIAEESSFLAIKSFYTIFKRSFGMTPVQYRKIMREQTKSDES